MEVWEEEEEEDFKDVSSFGENHSPPPTQAFFCLKSHSWQSFTKNPP